MKRKIIKRINRSGSLVSLVIVIVHKKFDDTKWTEIEDTSYDIKFSAWWSMILYITINDTLNRSRFFFELFLKNSVMHICDSHPKMKFYSKGINLISLYLIFFSSSALFSFPVFSIHSFFFSNRFIYLYVFELYSIYCVFCAIPAHHIDNEIIKYIRKSFFHLWLFIIDWSKHSVLFVRYFIEFHQTIILKVLNEIIQWPFPFMMSVSKDMIHFECQIKNTFRNITSSCRTTWNTVHSFIYFLFWYSLFSFPSSITSLSHRLSWETKEDRLWSSKYQNPSQKIRIKRNR